MNSNILNILDFRGHLAIPQFRICYLNIKMYRNIHICFSRLLCITWCLARYEEHGLGVFENAMLRALFNILLDFRFQFLMTMTIKTVVFLSLSDERNTLVDSY
jgi:hypothetical protein